MKRMLTLLPCAGFTALLYGLAGANPGALEINQDCAAVGCFAGDTAGFPVTITQPGSYVLTSDLSLTMGDAIDVSANASPIDIDLNGHTIDGGATCTGDPAVTSCTPSPSNYGISVGGATDNPAVAHIHGGTIRGFGAVGVIILNADDGTVLDHLTAAQNNYGALFQGVRTSTTLRVRDSQLVRNGTDGVGIVNIGSLSGQLQVENCTVAGNGTYGIHARANGGIMVGNRLSNNGSYGLYCLYNGIGTCAIGQNTFAGNNNAVGDQYSIVTPIDMGHNVCLDRTNGTCP